MSNLVKTAQDIEVKCNADGAIYHGTTNPDFHGDSQEIYDYGSIIDGSKHKGLRGKVLTGINYEDLNAIYVQWGGETFICRYDPGKDKHFEVRNAVIIGDLIYIKKLENCEIHGTVYVSNNETLLVSGDCKVEGQVVINSPEIRIQGVGNAHLTISDRDIPVTGYLEKQPLLGTRTRTGMSYGRWSRSDCNVEKIILTDVEVDIESNSPFTIGSYGYAKVPEIIFEDSANSSVKSSLQCPELTGTRWLLREAVPPAGSTKVSDACVYFISHTENGSDIPWSSTLVQLCEDIRRLNPDVARKVTALTYERNAKAIIELLQLSPDIDVSPLLEYKPYPNIGMVKCCCVLGIPSDLLYSHDEFRWMQNKINFILNKIGWMEKHPNADFDEKLYAYEEYILNTYGRDTSKFTPLQYRTVYELIPEYFFDFGGKSIEDCVDSFLQSLHK